MQTRNPAVQHALGTHDFAALDDQRRQCGACGLVVPAKNLPSTLMLQRVPVCMPKDDDAAQAN